jgi:diguanylate cyclase (GGDEF)-like protein
MLTGIPNRRAVFEKIDYLIAQQRPFWIGIFDLDGFKAINDVYGHVVGDSLLRGVVERSAALNLPGATFGRIGGDEFICIVSGSHTAQGIEQFGAKVIQAVSRPYPVGPMELTVGISAGFSQFPNMGTSGAQLYEQADFALYKAKTHRRGQCLLFETAESEEMQQSIAIERQLREADLESELYLLFQPQYSPSQQRVVGFEALAEPDTWPCCARPVHPGSGTLGPYPQSNSYPVQKGTRKRGELA